MSSKQPLPQNIRQAISLISVVFQRISAKRLDKQESNAFLTGSTPKATASPTTA
ncbi:MAG: hypothetical protein IJT83_15450 [Victivallales bacterium]|nr:hypothetical protein [Victivallales bacterium]